jgi:hypothetical protein
MRSITGLTRSLRTGLFAAVACVISAGLGAYLSGGARPDVLRADDKPDASHSPSVGVKAPIAEVLHCPLAFAGVHLLKEAPKQSAIAYHYCKPLNDEISQCILYDGTGPDARLIGIEYLVSDALYQSMSREEQSFWHDHKYEVDAGLLRSLTQRGDDEKATLAKVRPLWGKVFHTWVSGKSYPRGPAQLYWSVTGQEPFVLPADVKHPDELKAGK